MASPTKKPIVKVTVDVKEAQATEMAIGSDMVTRGMMQINTAHLASALVMETTKALERILSQRPSFATVE